MFTGEDCVVQFLDAITAVSLDLRNRVQNPAPLYLSSSEEREFQQAKDCMFCKKPFDGTRQKDRHHCHIEGEDYSITESF